MRNFYPFILFVSVFFYLPTGYAQPSGKDSVAVISPFDSDTLFAKVPISRALFVDKVKAQIKKSDLKDGEVDQIIELQNPEISQKLTAALLVNAPKIWVHIENMAIPQQAKIQYLHALETRFIQWNKLRTTAANANYIQKSVSNFDQMLRAIYENRIDAFVTEHKDIISLDNSILLSDFPKAKGIVFEAVGMEKPEMMIQRLPEFVNEPYADPIIAAAAKVVPAVVLNYANSTSNLSKAVRRNNDAYVKTIVAIADQGRNPQKLLPFIDEIYEGRKQIVEINAFVNNDDAYFKALVQLKLDNQSKVEFVIDNEINYRGLQYIRKVNELHESPAAVRFKSLQNFNAEDLYFMMIGSQDEIYTSSFIWMFNRMMEKMKPQPGNEFLDKVHKSHFRTFLRMAAGYGELSSFLNSMNEDNKNGLMKEFVDGLEQGPMNDLEDAVDVADAFGSLTDPKLIAFLQSEIKEQYNNVSNEKGHAIYALLYNIFNNASESAEMNTEFNDILPPITYVPQTALRDKDGKIIQHVFFYGDKDGMGAYNGYLSLFQNANWKTERGKYWATVTSTGESNIVVYVNVPLPEEAEENDVFAQQKLQKYLDDNDLKPSIVIHRGHSYYLPTTLEHLTPAAKIVILGSCGGYHNLAKVLNSSPDAHIISSKQVGAYRVNTPILNSLNNILLSGKNVNWVDMWKDLSKYFASKGADTKDLFSDYVPPHKNLGAIFIKAYRKKVATDEEQ